MNNLKNTVRTLYLGLFLPLTASALNISVDPTTPLTGTYAVEWNANNKFESWTTSQVTGEAVSDGVLSGTTSGTDPQVARSNIASGPDLDLGFNDFLELRIQVPASYADDIQIYYGTTATTGFGSTRIISIPNATIPKDGALHTYRIDVGPEPWWRATLRDLRIDPGNVSGVAFAIDYLRVGDEPNPTVYQPRSTTKCPAAGGATPAEAVYGPGQAVSSLESKHFRFIWNTTVTAQTGWTTSTARGTLRNLEEAWQVYVKILGYREPCFAVGTTSGTAYKLNVTSYYGGYWSGGDDYGGTSLAQLNATPDGLQVDPPTWIIPHELMHCFQLHNTSGYVPGEWWETHANYGRERWLQHYQNLYPNRSNIEALGVRDGHFMMSSGRNYYLTWPFMLYVDNNPDNLSDLYDGMMAKVWQETQANEFSMMTLDRLTSTTSLKDIVGYYARRCATWDFSNQSAMTAELNTQDPTRNARHLFTELIQRADDPTWWRVPLDKAPAQGAYSMHELVPSGTGAGRVVTVNLRGLADSARGADWRASFIAVSDSGVERYTPLWSTGSSSITLAADENKLYLSVAGTPDIFHYGGHDEANYHFRSHPSRSRFHYEVQVAGATPRERDNGSTAGLTQHSNGGGYRSVSVPTSVYIGPNARVTGGSVSGNARIEDYAVVSGGTVNSSAVVSGHAWVSGGTVTDFARVRDWAIVDSGTISGNARVFEHATVAASMQDTAVAKGSALHQSGTGVLSGNAIVDGDYMVNKALTNGVTFGHQPFVGVPDSFTTATPVGLYAAYDFKDAHDSRVLDQYGITDAFTTGSPLWVFTDGKRKGFLTFNGSSQSVTLDRSVADSRAFTFAAWLKPANGPANQAVLWLGASATRRLSLTASDASGQTKFSIVNGGAEQTLTTPALPVGVWSHIAVTLDGSTGVLYTNGVAAISGAITLRPDELLAPNTTTNAQHNYLARSEGSAMPLFQGSLDDVQFFSSALSAAQISAATVPLLSGVGNVLLSDNFNSGSYGAAAFNSTLAADQQGLLAPTAYTVTTGGQDWQAQHGNGAGMLLVGDAGYGSRASLNEDFSIAANGLNLPLSYQMDAWISDTSNGDCWSSIAIGRGQNLVANSVGAKFGILPKLNGDMEVWVNSSLMPLTSHSGNSYRIVLSDTAGTGSAFNGNGSKAELFNGATLVGTYTLPQLALGDGYLSFGANPYNGSFNITRIDNLTISKVPFTGLAALYYSNSPVQANIASLSALLAHFGANSPAPALVQTAPSMNFGGDGSGFPSPYNSGASGFEAFYSGKINIGTAGTYTFNTSSDDGSMLFIDGVAVVINNFDQPVTTRSGSVALISGMHDLVIAYNQGVGGYGMNAQMSGPDNTTMVDINTGNASITPDRVVGSLAGAGSVSLATGDLITGIDNISTNFSGVISGIGGVTKFGAGVQTFSGSNTYSGATWIAAGTLVADSTGTLGSSNLTVAAGATCELRNTSSAVADGASVYLTGSGRLDVAAGVAETVKFLYIDGVLQAAGTWNAGRDATHFAGEGSLVVTDGLPAAPSGLAATAVSTSAIDLSWADNTGNETGYLVERSLTSGSGFSEIAVLGADAVSYSDTGLAAGTTYHYRVRAGNAYGASAYCGEASASLPTVTGDGIWTSLSNGNWSLAVNWQDGIIADGVDTTATFAQTTGVTVTLDGARTLGGLSFANASYTLTGGSMLTLDTSAGTPSITVADGRSAVLSTVLAGTNGLAKTGAGLLTLSGANGYSGTTTVSNGTLTLQGSAFSTAPRDYTIAAGAVLNLNGDTSFAGGVTTISGDGTLRMSGGQLTAGADGRDLTLAMGQGAQGSAALIDIQTGASIINGGWQSVTWTDNKAGLNLDGTFDVWDGKNVFVDELTGSGLVLIGDVPWTTLNTTLSVGVNGGSGTFGGVISDIGSGDDKVHLVKEGSGIQILTGTNTYRGATTVNGGTLQIGDGGVAGTLGSGAVTLAGGAFLTFNRSDSVTFGQGISGGGSLVKQGAGALTLSGSMSYTGGTTINGGTLQAGGGVRNLGAGAVSLSGSGKLDIAALSANTGLAMLESSSGNLDQLSRLAFARRLLAVTSPSYANATAVDIGEGTGWDNHARLYTGMLKINTAGTYTFNTTSDDGSMVWIDGQEVVNNNYWQGMTTRSGSLALSAGYHDIQVAYVQGGGGYGLHAQYSGPDTGDVLKDLNTGNAQLTPDLAIGSLAGSGTVELSTGNLIVGTDGTSTTFSGVISADAGVPAGVLKLGAGTLTLSGANTYPGATTLAQGHLRLANASGPAVQGDIVLANGGSFLVMDHANQFGAGAGLTFSAFDAYAEFALYGHNQTIAGLSSVNGGAVVQNSHGAFGAATDNSTLTVNQAGNTTYSGILRDNSGVDTYTLALVKTGTGTLTLSGANSYSGATTISAGTLQLGNGGASGSLYSPSVASGNLTFGLTGAIENNSALVYNIAGGSVNVNKIISGTGTLSVTGNQSVNFAADTTITTSGSQTYSATATSGRYYGFNLSDSATVTLASTAGDISMTGMLGTANGSTGNLVVDTSAGNGNVTLNTPAGLSGVDYGLNALTVTAGTGTITLGTHNGQNWVTIHTISLTGGAINSIANLTDFTTLTITNSGASAFSGNLTAGGGAVVKAGDGTLTLSGANSYGGTTTISGGKLVVASSGTLGNGNLTVATGAVCELLNTAGAVADGASVSLADTNTLIIAAGVAETVKRLYVNNILQPSGTYTFGDGTLIVTEGVPAVPTGLSATAVSTSAINLSWMDNAGNETGYLVERSLVSGSGFSEIAVLGTDAVSYSDTGLAVGTTYHYRVCATNAFGASAFSGEASATTAPATGNGVWTNRVDGVWSVSGNWQLGTVADGTNATATFGQIPGVTVTLDSSRTLGGLDFSTTGYTITGANTLTFETTNVTSVLAVGSGASAILAVPVVGSDSLTKTGAGTLTLSGANRHSGGMTIEAGTLAGSRGTFGTGAVTVNDGGTLRLNDQWVFCGTNPYGVAEVGPSVLTLNAGSLLLLDPVQGFANGIGHLHLNGGSVSGGPDDLRGDMYLYNGNQQITAGGATSSTIASVIGVTGNNNTIAVETNSTLNISVKMKNADWFGNGSTPGGFIKAGLGTLALSGANTYSGVTTINAGTVLAANNTALGAGGFRGDTMTYISDGATLALQGGISLDEHFHVWGSGVGGLGAVRSISGTNALTSSYNGGAGYSLRSNTTVGVDADMLSITGFYQEGGSFILTKVGAGTLTMMTTSGYTGGTLINEGTIIAGAGGVALGAVTVASGAILTTTSASSTGLAALYYNNSAIDQANIASLPALLAHFGANSPAPALVQTAPSMNFGGDGSGFPAPYNSGASNFESFYSGKINIAVAGTYTFNTSSDDGSMLFIDGQVVVDNNVFQPVTTQTGAIALSAGMHDIVIAYNQGSGGYGMNAQMSGPDNTTMVDINTANASITPDLVVGSLAGAGSVALTTGNLIMGIDNSSSAFSGTIAGIGGVTKFGSGVQTLSGANSYSGATTISAGTLRIDGNSSGVLGALTVESGASLGGTGSYGGNITLKDGSGMSAELNLTDCTLACGGQLSFTNLDFAHCTFTVGIGAGYPAYRTFTLIEAASLGTVTFANADGMIDGVPAKLYINDNKLMLRVGRQGTYFSFH